MFLLEPHLDAEGLQMPDRLQKNSVSAQVSYYSALIQNNPEWEYAGVYADCGISGTGTARRSEFLSGPARFC